MPVLNGTVTFLKPTETFYTNVLTSKFSSITPPSLIPFARFCLYPRDIVYLWNPKEYPRDWQPVSLLSEFHMHCYFIQSSSCRFIYRHLYENIVIVRPFLVKGQPSLKECKYYKKELYDSCFLELVMVYKWFAIVKFNFIPAVIVVQTWQLLFTHSVLYLRSERRP